MGLPGPPDGRPRLPSAPQSNGPSGALPSAQAHLLPDVQESGLNAVHIHDLVSRQFHEDSAEFDIDVRELHNNIWRAAQPEPLTAAHYQSQATGHGARTTAILDSRGAKGGGSRRGGGLVWVVVTLIRGKQSSSDTKAFGVGEPQRV